MAVRDERGQAVVAAVLLVMVLFLLAGTLVDVYRLRETRNWAYRTAEAAALAGATRGRDLSTVYSLGRPRIDPATGRAEAEAVVLAELARRGVSGATYEIRVIEWGPETIAGYPPLARADMWDASNWTSREPAVGVYLEMPVETVLLHMAAGPIEVHAFAASGVAEE